MAEEPQEAETLVSSQSDDIPTKTLELDNPSSDFCHSDQTLDESSNIEDAHKTLEGFIQGEGKIEDAHNPKTLEESSKNEIGHALLAKTIEKSPEDDGFSSDGEKCRRNSSVESFSDCFSKCCHCRHCQYDKVPAFDCGGDDDDQGIRERSLGGLPLQRLHQCQPPCYRDCCHGYLGRGPFRYLNSSCEVEMIYMNNCGGGYYGNRDAYFRVGNPYSMLADPYSIGRYPCSMCRHPCYMGMDGIYKKHCEHRCCRQITKRETESSQFSFPTFNEPELHPVGAGLWNLGNTCFLNAIMQCFIHTTPLLEGLLSLRHDASSHGEDEFCILCAVRNQIELSLAYSGRAISPSNLVDNLSHISSFFRRYQQEDAHEFLQCLLDKLDHNWSKYEANAKDSSSLDDSLVKQVFGGRIVSQVHCSKCGHNSATYEPLIDLSLEIDNVDNLQSALESFTRLESIEDKFTCESCKEQVPVQKQLIMDQLPSVAALHLKRFKSDGVHVEKIDKAVEYPAELDLEPYTKGARATDGNVEMKCELYAVVVHVGLSSTSGHYFCYIRTSPDTWFKFDDSKVTRVSETTALSQDAYILFYARKGTSWFSSWVEKWKASSDRKLLNTSPKSVLDKVDVPSTSGGTSTERSSDLRHDEVENKARVDNHKSILVKKSENPSCIKSSTEVRYDEDKTGRINGEACSSSHVENTVDSDAKNDGYINTLTSPTSQIPNLYPDEEPGEATYSIPLGHLNIEDKASSSSKKKVDKAKHDLKKKEAVKYLSKSMATTSSRRRFFISAMMGSHSYSSLNKKRRKRAPFSTGKRVKIGTRRFFRRVAP